MTRYLTLASMAMFIELNGWTFDPDPPDVDEAWARAWLSARVRPVADEQE